MSNESRELAPDMFTLWLEDFIRSRASGKDVDTSSMEADAAIREIRARKGEPEKRDSSGSVKLATDVYRWDGSCLDVMISGQWEFAASANIHGEWFTYTPHRLGGRVHKLGKIDRAPDDTEGHVKDLAMRAAMMALDWEAYGLKRPEGL